MSSSLVSSAVLCSVVAMVLSSVPSLASVEPSAIDLGEVRPLEPRAFSLAVSLPPLRPPRADLLLIVDTTHSMARALDAVKAAANEVLADPVADRRWALAQVRDYAGSPCGPAAGKYGAEGDTPFELMAPFGIAGSELTKRLNALDVEVANDGDLAEGYWGALYRSFSSPDVDWRTGAAHIVILFADALPHDRGVGTGPDPAGGDCTSGSIDRAAIVAGLAKANIALFVVFSPSGPDPQERDAPVRQYWEALAQDVNGHLFDLPSAPEQAKVALQEVLGGVSGDIGRVQLAVVQSAGMDRWIDADGESLSRPPFYDHVSPPRTMGFDLDLTVPPGVQPGPRVIRILARGDDTELGGADVHFTVPPVAVTDPGGACEAELLRRYPNLAPETVWSLGGYYWANLGHCVPGRGLPLLERPPPNANSWRVFVDRAALHQERLAQ